LTAELLATSQTFHGDYFSWVEEFVALSAMAKVSFIAFAAVPMLNDTRLSQTEFYSLATGLYTCNLRDLLLDFPNFVLTLKIQISTRFTRRIRQCFDIPGSTLPLVAALPPRIR
jgi:hypothetical protein